MWTLPSSELVRDRVGVAFVVGDFSEARKRIVVLLCDTFQEPKGSGRVLVSARCSVAGIPSDPVCATGAHHKPGLLIDPAPKTPEAGYNPQRLQSAWEDACWADGSVVAVRVPLDKKVERHCKVPQVVQTSQAQGPRRPERLADIASIMEVEVKRRDVLECSKGVGEVQGG